MVLTESKLKDLYRKDEFKKFIIEKGTIITPAAREFLMEKKIETIEQKAETTVKEGTQKNTADLGSSKYIGISGESYSEKPEHMTQISGNILVEKNDKKIVFRGKLDSVKAKWLLLQREFEYYGNEKLRRDMESVTLFIKQLVTSEVLGIEVGDVEVLGENLERIKEVSHNPKKFFGRGHLFDISVKNSLLVLKLNELRSISRELELVGVNAFLEEKGSAKSQEMLRVLNRLSSVIYVMMLKAETGEYGGMRG